jgi:hypothetical protein
MTYAAYWEDTKRSIFRNKSRRLVRRSLPRGSAVEVSWHSTIGRIDGGDEFEFAFFRAKGRRIIVIPDPGKRKSLKTHIES